MIKRFGVVIVVTLLFYRCGKQSEFLQETEHLDFNRPIFSEVMNRVTTEDMSLEQKLEALYYFTRDSIPFASDASLYASEALQKNLALCYTKSMIYVSFCRKLGVPARLCSQQFKIEEAPEYGVRTHGALKVYYGGKWIRMDVFQNKDSGTVARVVGSEWFQSPVFSLEHDVVVDSTYISDLTFIDHETNDVPQPWLDHMQKFLDTGHW